MGQCTSVQDKAEKEISDEIDRQIEEDSRKFKKECKILLLGECYLLVSVGLSQRGGCRFWRRREEYYCEADEDYPSERV